MKLMILIFMLCAMAAEWTGSVAQNTRFCSLRIRSVTSVDSNTNQIRMRIELTYNSQLSPARARLCNRQINLSSTINCGGTTRDECGRVSNFLNTSSISTQVPIPITKSGPTRPTTTQVPTLPLNDVTSQCQPCNPSTIRECPAPTFDPPTSESDVSGQVSKEIDDSSSLRAAVSSLGVLVGVLVILLAVVISGWAWTCWMMKRTKAIGTTKENVRTTQNTAYGVVELVHSSTRDKQTSGLQERQNENDYPMTNEISRDSDGEEHEYHVLEGVVGGRHDARQNQELEFRQVIEDGEEHDYHILKGPGSVGQGREPEMREVGGATDYEIPQKLKKASSAH